MIFCPATNGIVTFETNEELDSHIAANLHAIPEDISRTTSDIARTRLTELLRSASLQLNRETQTILQHQNICDYDVSSSFHYRFVSKCGWALQTRRLVSQ